MLRVESLHELAKDNQEWRDECSSGILFNRYREFALIATRLKHLEESCADGMDHGIGELWERRRSLVDQIVVASPATIEDAIFKATILSSCLADGELQLGLTSQCVEDCDRLLSVEHETERCLKALEPTLWTACQRVRDELVAGRADAAALTECWWMEFRDSIRAIARHQALTSVGLKAKGEIFQEVSRFANETEGLDALQMSYMRDFGALAFVRLHGVGPSLQAVF